MCSVDAGAAGRAAEQMPGTPGARSASRTIVIQLPPHMAAEASSASLHAQAFLARNTALQALASAACTDQPFAGTYIEDVALYLQNVHNPSREIGLLFGGVRSQAGQPGSPRGAAGGAGSPLSPNFSAGFAVGGSAGGIPFQGAPQSLVLVGLRLGDAVLAFYMSFNERLPRDLLAAVRNICTELLAEVRDHRLRLETPVEPLLYGRACKSPPVSLWPDSNSSSICSNTVGSL
jgi:hypothetical protein